MSTVRRTGRLPFSLGGARIPHYYLRAEVRRPRFGRSAAALERVERVGDLFARVLELEQRLPG